MSVETGRVTTDIPARLDRFPWARWHSLAPAEVHRSADGTVATSQPAKA